METTSPSLKDLSIQFGEYFSQKDVAGLSTLLKDDFSLYDPALQWVRGKDQVLKVLEESFQAHHYVSYTTIDLFQDKQTTILRFEIVMDEKKFVGVDFMKWENDKMVELICYYNPPDKD